MAVHNEIIINRRGEYLVDLLNLNLILKRGLALSVETKAHTHSITQMYREKKKKRLLINS